MRIDTRLHVYPSGLDELTDADGETINDYRTAAAWKITGRQRVYTKFGGNDTDAQETF